MVYQANFLLFRVFGEECVTDIILNLKALCIKMYGEEPVVVRVEAQGEGEITAGDIIADPDVEILNPDLHLGDL